jgi:release factor glutamine methyltransferase
MDMPDNQIKSLLQYGINQLKKNHPLTAHLEAKLLLAKTLGLDTHQLMIRDIEDASPEQQQQYYQFIHRRQNKEPIAYLINQKEFFSIDFFVSPDVLIPRPETEHLVEWAIKSIPQNSTVLDLGCGSGCIAISIALNRPDLTIVASDISKAAIEIALGNAATHSVDNKIEFIVSDLFDQLASNRFDIILSNPPYIASQDYANLMEEVRLYEPEIALKAGAFGLDFYKRLAAQSSYYLHPAGKVAVEIGVNQEKEVQKIFSDNGFKICQIIKDFSNRERHLVFQMNH